VWGGTGWGEGPDSLGTELLTILKISLTFIYKMLKNIDTNLECVHFKSKKKKKETENSVLCKGKVVPVLN
jgi:hypothetical protein